MSFARFTCAAAFAACAAAAGAQHVPSLQGERVVRIPAPAGFQVTQKLLRQGMLTPGGYCQFNSEMRLGPDEAALEEIELEYDPATCRSIVIQGRSTTQAPASKAGQPTSSAVSAAGALSASYKTWFADPINLTLNSVESRIAWAPVGDCASGTFFNSQPVFYRLEQTGWYTVSSGSKPSSDCGSVALDASAMYQSDSFPTCVFASPQAIYDYNIVTGYADGSSTGKSQTRRAGQALLCTNLWTERKRLTKGSTSLSEVSSVISSQ
ncbi:hypothetical protein OOT46_28610 [Aquabacterium sp. A7-Y]|uniref:hypothetical protein n=1 Tax=Aquabacterium sp. A7-Y TaxID=1349605 RepID=UPI00223D7B4C|nr:hypothetical protein [Aquabacterium sp. A7-Y]MCW7541764.1 hypothetical protein [Aquabacterium sp. A7-Y]